MRLLNGMQEKSSSREVATTCRPHQFDIPFLYLKLSSPTAGMMLCPIEYAMSPVVTGPSLVCVFFRLLARHCTCSRCYRCTMLTSSTGDVRI
ncbi:hypothetical protein P692DRAFT_20294267 [Suillus brevipes Sb2]|nr:hypothetical protein P692DRAFT_20294267 [Suillus brevipes Sb2]